MPWITSNLSLRFQYNRCESWGLPSLTKLDHRTNLRSLHLKRTGGGDLNKRCTTGAAGAGPTSHVDFFLFERVIRGVLKVGEIEPRLHGRYTNFSPRRMTYLAWIKWTENQLLTYMHSSWRDTLLAHLSDDTLMKLHELLSLPAGCIHNPFVRYL